MLNIFGFLVISFLGTISHFIYDLSNHNKYAQVFFAVNESTWEHMKLVVYPSLFWALVEYPLIGSNPNFVVAKLASLLTMLILIPLFFYLYKFLFKKSDLIFDIVEFFISIAAGQFVSFLILQSLPINKIYNYIAFVVYITIVIYFSIATLIPGKGKIYVDPLTNKKGKDAHI